MKRTRFLSIKIESDLRSFEKNNIIERASCKTQNEVLTVQIWLSVCFYSKIACNCWKEVNSCINFTRIFRSFYTGQRNQKSYISQKIVDIVNYMQKNTGKMYHKRLVTHSFMEEPFLSSEIALHWRSFLGVTIFCRFDRILIK